MLQVAQHSVLQSGNPKALNVAMAKMPRMEEFCTREPHFESEEVFGSQKPKQIYPSDLNTNHTGLTESTSPVHESRQGPLVLGVLVAA
jgi:hypothetical protein